MGRDPALGACLVAHRNEYAFQKLQLTVGSVAWFSGLLGKGGGGRQPSE